MSRPHQFDGAFRIAGGWRVGYLGAVRSMPRSPNTRPRDDKRWAAVESRSDAPFFYGVRSTRIFCRPTCPSRRPRRAVVEYFDTAAAAQAAGFRPCRRCDPLGAARGGIEREIVERACRHILEHPDRAISHAALAAAAGVPPSRLRAAFRRALGVTPRAFAMSARVGALKHHLRKGAAVTDAVYLAGYGSSSRVYEHAAARLGMSPATYGRGGRGATIAYTIQPSPIGLMLLAGTEAGVCAVQFGDSERALVDELRREYPAAEIHRGGGTLERWAGAVVRHLESRASHDLPNVPLDVRATAFQWRVWEELRRIPFGVTRSYTELAHATGQPRAVRAVARACATNPVALVIPCHRVVRQGGALGGYRWGLERKRRLIEREKP